MRSESVPAEGHSATIELVMPAIVSASALREQGLTVDVIAGTVAKSSVPIGMGARERAIVMALAINRNGLSRERLAEMAYANSPNSGTPGAMKVHIHRLRRRIGADFIVRRDRQYALGAGVSTAIPDHLIEGVKPKDVRPLDTAGIEALRLLARKLRSPILDGMEYFDWYIACIANYQRVGRELALTLAREVSARGEYLEAIQIAMELTFEDPCDEEPWEELIRAQLALGQRSAALHGYRFLRVALEKDLGVAPSPSLSALLSV